MKTCITFFWLILLSVSVFAQNNHLYKTEKEVSDHKFQFYNNKEPNMDVFTKEYPEIGCYQALYMSKPGIENRSKAIDTVFVEFYANLDSLNYDFYMMGCENNYSEEDIIWTFENKNGYLLVEPGQYITLTNLFEYNFYIGKGAWRIIFNNINVSGNTQLEINNTAIYPINFNLVNKDSISFSTFTKVSYNHIDFILKLGNNFDWFSFSTLPKNDFYVSSVADSILLNFGFNYQDVDSANEGYFLKFPSIWGLNDTLNFINNPHDYISTNVKVNIPQPSKADVYLDFMYGAKYEVGDDFFGFGFGSGSQINWTGEWNGKFYANYQQDLVKGTLGLLIDADPTSLFNYFTPEDDSIGDFIMMHPDAMTLFYGNDDTIKIGSSCFYLNPEWLNNINPNYNLIVAYYKYGINVEYYHDLNYHFVIYDHESNNIGEGNNGGIMVNLPPAAYSILQNCTIRLGEYLGYYSNKSYFDLTKTDADPPILYLRTCNALARPTWKFNKADQAYLLFWAKDINNPSPFYAPINDDSTKVYYKYFNEGVWQEITAIKTGEDSMVGSHYKVDLSYLTNRDSSAISIKIEIVDMAGNKSITIIDPAIIIGSDENSITTYNYNGNGLSVYPNPFKNEVSLGFSLKETSDLLLEIYDITGKKINSMMRNKAAVGNNTIIWNGKDASGNDLPVGMYFYKLSINHHIFNGKLLKY